MIAKEGRKRRGGRERGIKEVRKGGMKEGRKEGRKEREGKEEEKNVDS